MHSIEKNLDKLQSFSELSELYENPEVDGAQAFGSRGDASTWAYKFFFAGFRTHPLTVRMRPYLNRNRIDPEVPVRLEFEKMPAAGIRAYPLTNLNEARTSPDDMLRTFGPVAETAQLQYTLAAEGLSPLGTVLDLGCGFGHGAAILQAIGSPASYVGVDRNAEAIEYASVCYGGSEHSFVGADLDEGVPSGGQSADSVVALQVVQFLRDPERFVGDVARVLKPGGTLAFSVPNRWYRELGTRPSTAHRHAFDLTSCLRLLQPAFSIREVYGHTGDALVNGSYRRLLEKIDLGGELDWNPEWYLFLCERV